MTDSPANLKHDPVTYIYALAEPARGNIRYIGKANDVSRRMRRHMKDARDGRADHKSRWLASMIRNGDQPRVIILEACSESIWKERERFWIAHCRNIFDLCNSKDGGDGLDPTPEVRERMSAAKRGQPARNRGQVTPADVRAKQSEAARRRWARMSQEERDAFHARNRGRVSGQALRSGWNHTPEARAKIAAASRSRGALSPEQVAEIRRELAVGAYGLGRVLAARYGVTESVISAIKHGRAYRDEVPA